MYILRKNQQQWVQKMNLEKIKDEKNQLRNPDFISFTAGLPMISCKPVKSLDSGHKLRIFVSLPYLFHQFLGISQCFFHIVNTLHA